MQIQDTKHTKLFLFKVEDSSYTNTSFSRYRRRYCLLFHQQFICFMEIMQSQAGHSCDCITQSHPLFTGSKRRLPITMFVNFHIRNCSIKCILQILICNPPTAIHAANIPHLFFSHLTYNTINRISIRNRIGIFTILHCLWKICGNQDIADLVRLKIKQQIKMFWRNLLVRRILFHKNTFSIVWAETHCL